METIIFEVAWLPVVVSFVVAFVVGWVWYSERCFGIPWQRGIGISADDQTPMLLAMVTQLGSTFLLAWLVGVLLIIGDWHLIALLAVTFSGILKANGFFSQKTKMAIAIEVGYVILAIAVMAGVQSVM